jgi:hypothetical protein
VEEWARRNTLDRHTAAPFDAGTAERITEGMHFLLDAIQGHGPPVLLAK